MVLYRRRLEGGLGLNKILVAISGHARNTTRPTSRWTRQAMVIYCTVNAKMLPMDKRAMWLVSFCFLFLFLLSVGACATCIKAKIKSLFPSTIGFDQCSRLAVVKAAISQPSSPQYTRLHVLYDTRTSILYTLNNKWWPKEIARRKKKILTFWAELYMCCTH